MSHSEINKAILNRELFSGQEEGTYFNQELYNFFCDNYYDPYLLFKIKIKGYYQKLYKWTDAETDKFIEDHKEKSIKWTDGIQEYYYDWGKGKNQVTENYLHFPNLDHIIPASIGEVPDNRPENFRIRCRRLNENRGNTNTDKERRATIIDMFNDMGGAEQQDLLKYLKNIAK
jgi:hypothetical protein